MEDISAIETLLKASGADAHQPLNNEEEQPSATKIMEDMNFIGGKITEVSIRKRWRQNGVSTLS